MNRPRVRDLLRRKALPGLASLLVSLVWPVTVSGAPSRLPAELSDPRGDARVTLEAGSPALHIVFFATWCPPCVAELDGLAELEARWSERGYRLVLVAVKTRQSRARLAGFLEDRKPPGELLFDAEGRLERSWKIDQLPAHVLLDATGVEVLRTEVLDDRVDEALPDLLRDPGGARRGGP